MAKQYFRQVPDFEYVSRNKGEQYISEYIPVKNLFKRGKIRDDIFGNLAFFEKYSIIGDERPDNVAAKFYGDPTLDWVVLLSNNILNIQSEWPLTQKTLEKVLLEKYGSYENLYNPHHYETNEIRNSLGVIVLESGIRISPTWKTNGNFIEAINTTIVNITASRDEYGQADGVTPSNIVTVSISNEFPALPGDQITIDGVSEREYNGKFIVKENFGNSFTYELPEIPKIIKPRLSQGDISTRKEKVIATISENPEQRFITFSPDRIARYYEYWDPGFATTVLVPADFLLREVTNYDYEFALEEAKRNIYLLKPRYLNVIFNDLDDVFAYKRGSQQFVTETLKRADNIRLYE